MKGEIFRIVALVLIICFLAAGCTATPVNKADHPVMSLKVLYSDEDGFYRKYGDLFTMSQGNVHIDVVSTRKLNADLGGKTYEEALAELVEQERPDVLFLGTSDFRRFAEAGQLMELDPLMESDKYSLEGVLPGLEETLRELGSGKLYGLNPFFYGSAVYYNKNLFEKYGVKPPHDNMTWQEIMDLAMRFPAEGEDSSRTYGFGGDYAMSFDYMVLLFSLSEGLTYINPDSMQVTIDTEAWLNVYELALRADASGALYNPAQGDETAQSRTVAESIQNDPFLTGRSALTVNGALLLQRWKEAQDVLTKSSSFEIGIVSGPVDPANPDTTREITLDEIVAIRAGSENSEAAWEFFKFVNGGQFAKIRSKTLYSLPSRMDGKRDYAGISLDAFYRLKPKLNLSGTRSDRIPPSFYSLFEEIRNREIEKVREGDKTLEEALQAIQMAGQAALDASM